jgi:LmbE family N-acetylglucosaminyl deacetylase
MYAFNLEGKQGTGLKVLCLGAHADDIEIGCGGFILSLLERHSNVEVSWVVFSATPGRRREARGSADLFLRRARRKRVVVKDFRDGFFPYHGARIKRAFELLKRDVDPDIVLTHYRDDRHQDHRVLSDMAWNTFRDHLILEYEIPKFDGDLGTPNSFVPLTRAICARKVKHLMASFGSQRQKHWFSPETFMALMRLRGMECRAADGYAEAFYARKALLLP